jgi:2-methylisocitrate lyase-like PEP mutase family enzyme
VIYERERAAERIAAAAEAARALDFQFTLTARAENFLRENSDLDDTIARLRAYEEAGADVLFAPGLRTAEEIRAICEAVGKPVNVLGSARLGLTLEEIAKAGAQRVSVGGGLTWAAVDAAIAVAERIIDDGDFSGLSTPGRVREWLAG